MGANNQGRDGNEAVEKHTKEQVKQPENRAQTNFTIKQEMTNCFVLLPAGLKHWTEACFDSWNKQPWFKFGAFILVADRGKV